MTRPPDRAEAVGYPRVPSVVLDDAALARVRDALALVPNETGLDEPVQHARYRPLDVLGEGGMGTVYRCMDDVLGREVALKVVRAATPAREAVFAARLQAESRILARLEHAGIVPIHDAGRLPDGRAFYVMQRLRGRTLHEVLEAQITAHPPLPLTRRLDLLERITEAVAFAHEQGVVHRDLKPDNVMVGEFGEVHVTDWGVARVLFDAEQESALREAESVHTGDTPSERLTSAGTVLGTPGFMAPEQAAGLAHTVGPPADVYALGALLVTVLTGRVPLPGGDPFALLVSASTSVEVPPPLRAIAERCLHTDPAQRYPHGGSLLEELRRYRSGDPVAAYREGVFERLLRVLRPWRTALVLLVAYLAMRMIVAWLGSGRFAAEGGA